MHNLKETDTYAQKLVSVCMRTTTLETCENLYEKRLLWKYPSKRFKSSIRREQIRSQHACSFHFFALWCWRLKVACSKLIFGPKVLLERRKKNLKVCEAFTFKELFLCHVCLGFHLQLISWQRSLYAENNLLNFFPCVKRISLFSWAIQADLNPMLFPMIQNFIANQNQVRILGKSFTWRFLEKVTKWRRTRTVLTSHKIELSQKSSCQPPTRVWSRIVVIRDLNFFWTQLVLNALDFLKK